MVLEERASGNWVGHEGSTLINVISDLTKEIPNPFHHVRSQIDAQAMNQEEVPDRNTIIAGTLILDLSGSRLEEANFCSL